jgi:PadR family transcriptional regulator PadR
VTATQMAAPRVTLAVATVLQIFLENPNEPRYGYDLMRQTGFPSGVLYRVLGRLQRADWLSRDPDQPGASVTGGQPRHMYRLTDAGAAAARDQLAALSRQLRLTAPSTPQCSSTGDARP